mmetsp:Transcript_59929/g.82010  ORF Transcript_59929/g.82010 Transcript_59929/m.82010 type:complete len:227 (-) Transcript_59929:622-1302(-)
MLLRCFRTRLPTIAYAPTTTYTAALRVLSSEICRAGMATAMTDVKRSALDFAKPNFAIIVLSSRSRGRRGIVSCVRKGTIKLMPSSSVHSASCIRHLEASCCMRRFVPVASPFIFSSMYGTNLEIAMVASCWSQMNSEYPSSAALKASKPAKQTGATRSFRARFRIEHSTTNRIRTSSFSSALSSRSSVAAIRLATCWSLDCFTFSIAVRRSAHCEEVILYMVAGP